MMLYHNWYLVYSAYIAATIFLLTYERILGVGLCLRSTVVQQVPSLLMYESRRYTAKITAAMLSDVAMTYRVLLFAVNSLLLA